MIEIEHDKEAPAWLGQWLTEEEINARYSPVLIANAKAFSMRIQRMVLKFTPFSLRATMDAFHPVWHLENGVWSCRCDCGYPKPECIHTYLATFLFKLVCQKEKWAMPVGRKTPRAQPQKEGQATKAKNLTASSVQPRHQLSSPLKQLTFFADDASFDSPRQRPQPPSPRQCSLVCEADFNSNRYGTVLRFYRVEKGERTQMLLSAVRLFGLELEKVEMQGASPNWLWSEKDKEFIRWLHLKLRELPMQQLGKRELCLNTTDFWRWMERWKQEPGRIVEATSQKAIDAVDIGKPKELVVRLFDHKSFVRVALLLVMENGREYHFKDLQKLIAEDPTGCIVRNRLSSFNSPISFDALNSHFGQASADISRGDLCRRLPEMLEGQLEILQPSSCLQVVEEKEAPLRISVRFDGYNFYLMLQSEHQNWHIGKDGMRRRLDYRNGSFVLFFSKTDSMPALENRIRKLMDDADGSFYNDEYFCKGTIENAFKIRQFWNELPQEVNKRCDDNTKGLLDGTSHKTMVELSLHARGNLVELSASCRCGKAFLPLRELQHAAMQNNTLVRNSAGQWFDIDPDSLREALKALSESGVDEGQLLMLPDKAADAMKHLEELGVLQLEDRSVSFAQRLAKTTVPELPPIDSSLLAILRPYQRIGTQFLLERSRFGVGAILADDMGLGKTLEVLAMLDAWRRTATGKRFRALVVAPASVVPVWVQQSATFCRDLKTTAMVGDRHARQKVLEKDGYDLLVTHYGLVRSEIAQLSQLDFDFVVLDEAQAIKNPDAQISSAVRTLEAGCRMALTGTPLENSLSDLWSIMDFINPGLLGKREDFLAQYGSASGRVLVAHRLNMLMIRRTKEMVAPELPPKTEELQAVEMPPEMRKDYNKELVKARLSADSFSAVNILAAITRLRMFCCAPELLEGLQEKFASPKLLMLMERLTELLESGHSVLVFSQFTSMLKLIEAELVKAQMNYRMITGEVAVEKRARIVQEFEQDESPSVFLLSLKAAGTGLTLTKADYVFLFDPWWNPAVENQAIDRTHRIGQDKPVFAYRLIVKDSIEEKVLQIVESKRQLFAEVIDSVDASGNDSRLTLDELRGLLK
ncbi:MAG: DEAD/DEAH box helicase [Victivallales bacterium]|nr:DEAD/DEAH box helicase [Victivallales bacterium]